MTRQGPTLAIARLNPVFVRRLAAAHREARDAGLPVCVFSAYRPPGWGVGGFANKYNSEHSYGLAVDEGGLSRSEMVRFAKIAARHGVYRPYSAACEYNHFAPTKTKMVLDVVPALRRTIVSDGPRLLERMWQLASAIIMPEGLSAAIAGEGWHHHARRVHVRYAHAHHHHVQVARG